MKAAVTALVLLALTTGIAFAGPCDDDLKKVDAALASDAVPAEQKAQVQDMRSQAAELCGAGNEQEGVDVLTEAKAMLAIE
ncbi:hypothetical protein [Aestuariivirga sp.]|uniref:hypothetical protein n=1 Tax=Aestuariivirga sp. TaxID=2650926 RepID=UPI0035949407